MFGSTDSVIKTVLQSIDPARFVILDFARVIDVDAASAKLLADLSLRFAEQGKALFYTGTGETFAFRRYLLARTGDFGVTGLLRFADTDRALEWCEDELIREHDPGLSTVATASLEAQYLCAGLPDEQLIRLRSLCRERVFPPGDIIFEAGDPGHAFYLVTAGRVEIEVTGKGHRKKRLVTVRPGMSFGEFSMVNQQTRSARAVAVTETTCYEIACGDLDEDLRARLLAHLAGELARRLSREARELEVLNGRV
jgi:glutaminase